MHFSRKPIFKTFFIKIIRIYKNIFLSVLNSKYYYISINLSLIKVYSNGMYINIINTTNDKEVSAQFKEVVRSKRVWMPN